MAFDLRRRLDPPVVIYSDAMYEADGAIAAGGGFVIFIPEPATGSSRRQYRVLWGADTTDARFVQAFVPGKKQYIGVLEIAYGVAPYMSAPDELHDQRVIHFIDNTGAIAGLVKGYARAVDSGVLVNAFHAYNAGLSADVFFEYVRSKANIADMPSRLGIREMLEVLGALGVVTTVERIDIVLPDNSSWRASAASWLRRGGAPPAARAKPAPPRVSVGRACDPHPPRAVVVCLAKGALRCPFTASLKDADARRDVRSAAAQLLRRPATADVATVAHRYRLAHEPGLATGAARAARAAALDQLLEAYDAGITIHLVCPGAPSPCYADAIVAWINERGRHSPSKRARDADDAE